MGSLAKVNPLSGRMPQCYCSHPPFLGCSDQATTSRENNFLWCSLTLEEADSGHVVPLQLVLQEGVSALQMPMAQECEHLTGPTRSPMAIVTAGRTRGPMAYDTVRHTHMTDVSHQRPWLAVTTSQCVRASRCGAPSPTSH
jgi:hypothetical protein